jgi:3-hydroxypropanoate dehydrogenase
MVDSVPVDSVSFDQLFREARTFSYFLPKPVAPATLQAIHELLKWGPTATNAQPGHFLFLVSPASRERLKPALSTGNLAKTMAAPVTVVVAEDLQFHETLATKFPHGNAQAWFDGQAALIAETARRSSSLQGAYFILAARALGLDCGPMSGFDATQVDKEFFPDGRYRANFLINLGYGDRSRLHARLPRLTFDEACQIL